MRIAEAEAEFRRFMQQSGSTPGGLRLATGYALVLAFYRDRRVEGIESSNPEADMLLYQWGTYDWVGAGPTFQIDFTRQFIEQRDGGDDVISQLSLRFHFEPDTATRAFGAGDRWLTNGQDGLARWRSTVEQSPPYRFAAELQPARVELGWSPV